jgi:hypothetical protein
MSESPEIPHKQHVLLSIHFRLELSSDENCHPFIGSEIKKFFDIQGSLILGLRDALTNPEDFWGWNASDDTVGNGES